jgi:uncharacterized protein (DUF2141 family)
LIKIAQNHDLRDQIKVFSVIAICLVALARCMAQAVPPQRGVIHVDVVGLRNDKGQVFCALYVSAEGFPKDSQKALRRDNSSITEKKASCEFSGIERGTYAVSVFQDENSNGKLDTNFLGIPREGVGASNDARGHMGPPKFDAAQFQFSGARLDLKITINYL